VSDILAILGVLFILALITVITKLFFKHKKNAELSRKTVHITMGLTALSFPFIFDRVLSVVILGILAFGAMLLLRFIPMLRNSIGTTILGIKRESYGELYFVFSIAVIFALHKSTFEYIIPILVLTFADSVAALIGSSYGRYNMAYSEEDVKSSEGSVLFFIVAFMCALVPLQLMTEIGRAEVLLISFLIGLLGAMIEAISSNGNDNLLLPLLTYSFLRYNIQVPIETLFLNFGVMLFFLIIIMIVYSRGNISKLSIFYALLVAYASMVLGGTKWVLLPAILLVAYGNLPKMGHEEKQMVLSYKIIASNAIVGMICLWASVFFPEHVNILYLAFSFSFACFLAINTYSRIINFEKTTQTTAALAGFVKGAILIALPTFLFIQVGWVIIVAYLTFLTFAIPPSIILNKKLDYKNVNSVTANANTVLVGTLTAIFAGGLFLWFI